MKSEKPTIRTFAAIFPPPEIIEEIYSAQQQLASFFNNVRWEKKEKFHFTLQFWGDQTESWLTHVHEKLLNEISVTNHFPIRITSIGSFPNNHLSKIIWIGSSPSENPELNELAQKIFSIAKSEGFAQEKRPFHPHITIGRIKGNSFQSLTKSVESLTLRPMEFYCKYLHIIKSQLATIGSTYSTLYTIPLK